MKYLFYLFCFFLTISSSFSKSSKEYFNFIDPLPGAKYINREACIIIKPGDMLQKQSLLENNSFIITGSLSGNCHFSMIKSSDNQTIILKPLKPFQFGEEVEVEFTSNIRTRSGTGLKPFSYSFTISSGKVKVNPQYSILAELNDREIARLPYGYYNYDLIKTFPQPILNYIGNPAPGRILIADFSVLPQYSFNLMVLNNDATVFNSFEKPSLLVDFNMQPNGNLTYYDVSHGKYLEMDYYYNIVDYFYCGNGYDTDFHELRLLPNRHALLMSYDSQYVDMSQIVPGGNANCVVSGLIVQEIDEAKNVVFQWRSWDNFQITDAWHEDLLASHIDAVHGNAIELDNDGNLMISSRHLDEITKINRTTGEVMWRFGGMKNQFTFTGDTLKFNYQHAIRRLKNGNIMLYDNGNYHSPAFSRAVEYALDEDNKIAHTVWQYRNPLNTFGGAMGNAQRLDNGNTLIGWGYTWPTLTEVNMDGTKELEVSLPPAVVSYRAFKYIYKENETKALFSPESIFLSQNYPNPFNPKTTISFGVPRINGNTDFVDVQLIVYDVLGREIAVLVDKPLKPYAYNFDFDGSSLSSGIYFYTLYASGNGAKYYETKKMILVK